MKEFNPIKTLQRFMIVILVLTLICTGAVYYLLGKKQSYSASILIEYTGPKAEKGLNPDDTEIDVSEIYSATVIEEVIDNLNLECNVEDIRGAVVVQPIIPLTETKRETAAIELNMEFEFIPTKYLVTYTAESDFSEEYARDILDTMLMEYYIMYSQKYIENIAPPNNAVSISLDDYDYIECVNLMRENLNSLATYCMARDPHFYSAKCGYSFTDLQLEFEYVRDISLYDLNVYVLEHKLTKDRELLLQKENNNLTRYEIKLDNTLQYIEQQREIISAFAEKTLDGQVPMSNLEGMGIITNVEEGWEWTESIDTTYDILVQNYSQLLMDANYYESEIEKTNKIISIYSTDIPGSSNGESEVAKKRLDDIIEKFNELYDNLLLVVKDYYNVSSAKYISFNSNVQTNANVNLKMYVVVAGFMFLVVWACVFVAFDRIKDIIIYNKQCKKKEMDMVNEIENSEIK